MILTDLGRYLAAHRLVALRDLAYRFDSDPESLRAMLAVLERKGRVRRVESPAACASSCGKCDPASMETYQWLGSRGDAAEAGCERAPGGD